MAITITLTANELANKIFNDQNACWSWDGAMGLAEYLTDLTDDIGDMELDLVSIRCDFSEYTWKGLADAYSNVFTADDGDTLWSGNLIERTQVLEDYDIDVIWHNDGLVIIREF